LLRSNPRGDINWQNNHVILEVMNISYLIIRFFRFFGFSVIAGHGLPPVTAGIGVWLDGVGQAVTGQLADTPTRGLPTRGLDDSQTGHLADWSTRGQDNSRTGQVADWTTRGCHRRLCVLSFRSFGGICETASCPVR